MLIITTGISGSGRKDFVHKFKEIARRNKKKIRIFEVGQMIFDQAAKVRVNISHENVLNANPYVLNSLRSAVFETILNEMPEALKKNDAVIINVHSFFYWKKIFMRTYDWFYMNRLKPDLLVTFIDDGISIKRRLDQREQWKSEHITPDDILTWQNIEVEVTASWAELHRKPFYAMSIREPVASLFRLAFHPEVEPIYVSMPMTHLPKEDQVKVSRLVDELAKYFVVFDPRTIEIDTGASNKKIDIVNYNQTVLRDLYWLIRQSKKIIAYFPRLVSSPGVINELREGYETNKDVWLIYPNEAASPFLTYFTSKLFRSEEEFLKFLRSKYKPAPKVR